MQGRFLTSPIVGVALGLLLALLVLIWPSFPSLLPGDPMKDPNPAVRVAAIRAGLGQSSLIAALQDEDADVRLVAAQHLGGDGQGASERARALVGALGDAHAGVRREVAETLQRIGAAAVPALSEALRHPDARVRAGAVLALGDPPKQPRDRSAEEQRLVVPPLSGLLKDPDAEVRRQAVRTLAWFEWDTAEARNAAIPACREALRDEDPAVREGASRALQRHGVEDQGREPPQ